MRVRRRWNWTAAGRNRGQSGSRKGSKTSSMKACGATIWSANGQAFLQIWREIRAECEAKGFQPPTRRTVKARLDAMDQREVFRKRRGAEEADKVFAARPGRLEVAAPLEC